MMFPLIREAEEILNQAQRRTRKSHCIYNNSIMNIKKGVEYKLEYDLQNTQNHYPK